MTPPRGLDLARTGAGAPAEEAAPDPAPGPAAAPGGMAEAPAPWAAPPADAAPRARRASPALPPPSPRASPSPPARRPDAGAGLPGTEASAVTLRPQRPSPGRGARREDVGASPGTLPDAAPGLGSGLGLGVADLDADPPDPALLEDEAAPVLWMRLRVLPWRRIAGQVVWASDGTLPPGVVARRLSPDPAEALFVEVAPAALDRAYARRFDPLLAGLAAHRLPRAESVRGLVPMRVVAAALVALLLAAVALGGAWVLPGMLAIVLGLNVLTTLFRLAALLRGWHAAPAAPRPPAPAALPASPGRAAADGAPSAPMVSLLVPLFREAGMIDQVLGAIGALDYPAGRLETKLVVEADDAATRGALAARSLPEGVSVLIVPPGRPRTKPRALNYALGFCRGTVIGILDAEDRPAPGQIRDVIATFAALPARYGCVQCQLTFHNARENWISRCFQIEYALWFDVLLRGWERLGLPMPLGGTSVYFRRAALEDCDGWDAHNVTEDADLGMRLHRRGWRTRLIDSVTEEEASCRPLPWLRQRSRWLKGFALTWMSHLRRPGRLVAEMGVTGTLAFHLLFLGGMVAYLAMPLFWLVLAIGWITGEGVLAAWLTAAIAEARQTTWLPAVLGGALVAGQAVMVAAAARALWRRGAPGLVAWLPLMPVYWTLGAAAAWKAVVELFLAPSYWDKTAHGVSRLPRRPDDGG